MPYIVAIIEFLASIFKLLKPKSAEQKTIEALNEQIKTVANREYTHADDSLSRGEF